VSRSKERRLTPQRDLLRTPTFLISDLKEIVKIAATPDGSAPPYQLVFTAYFESADALQNAMMSPRMAEVMGDLKNFYDGMPDVMIGEVLG
jgi:uncharacterized protein (TIGR02118 family)